MITDKDIQKLSEVFATKEDLKGLATKDYLKSLATKEELKGRATKKDLDDLTKHVNELAGDVVKVHKKVEELDERVKRPALLEKAFSFAPLKAEHERMKKISREKLQVEV